MSDRPWYTPLVEVNQAIIAWSFRQFYQSLHLNPTPLIHSRSLYSRKSSTVRDQPKLNEPEVPLRWIAGYLNQRFEEDSPQSYRNMTIISTLRLWERHTPLVEVNQAVNSSVVQTSQYHQPMASKRLGYSCSVKNRFSKSVMRSSYQRAWQGPAALQSLDTN